jgi:hypothetical protein
MVLLNKRARVVTLVVLGASLLAFSCKPDVAGRASLIDVPRVIAIAAEPPEAEEGDSVAYSALIVDASGAAAGVPSDWALCTARKPLALIEPINPICLSRAGDFLVPLGQGDKVTGKIPKDACRNFGPEVPPPKVGEPDGRPTDPDSTGGYYQPLRVLLARADGDYGTLGSSRIACGTAGASSADVAELKARYHYNANPAITALLANGAPIGRDAAHKTSVASGSVVHLEVDWPGCPDVDVCGDGICGPDETRASCKADCAKPTTTSVGCGGAERYVAYDRDALAIVTRRELMRASWFTTAGVFSVDASGRDEDDRTTSAANDLSLDGVHGDVFGWVVLTDARGGATWASFVLSAP